MVTSDGDAITATRRAEGVKSAGRPAESACVHDEPGRQGDPIAPLSELDAYAEHRAALDATLFDCGTRVVLELRDGALHPSG